LHHVGHQLRIILTMHGQTNIRTYTNVLRVFSWLKKT